MRIRTYKTVKKMDYVSKWSKKKAVTVKGKAAATSGNDRTIDETPIQDVASMFINENAGDVIEADGHEDEAIVALSDE
ncbi:MAG: hypothetical protein IJH38_09640 [Clostridia bacterium]|nr:hypothetical protein [Clostridia bacterium]